MDGNSIGYAVRASPPANYEDVIKGVTAALEELETRLLFCESTKNQYRRGNFKTVSFGSSYGGGQTVSSQWPPYFHCHTYGCNLGAQESQYQGQKEPGGPG